MNITVIDYLGNISSIVNMIKKIGANATVSNQIDAIYAADKLILPGVGAFDHGMQNLQAAGLLDVLHHEVLVKKKPILGICLGMQLFLNTSDEGKLNGLGWIKGHSAKFKFNEKNNHLKVPHMGWNEVIPCQENFFLSEADNRFYFVHSYHAICETDKNVIGKTIHGYAFPAIIQHNHIVGVQFHPEKSHRYGMTFLKKFIELNNEC